MYTYTIQSNQRPGLHNTPSQSLAWQDGTIVKGSQRETHSCFAPLTSPFLLQLHHSELSQGLAKVPCEPG